jgi:chromosome segregation ATPase
MNTKELREQYELNVGHKVLVIDGTTVDGYIRHLESRLTQTKAETDKLNQEVVNLCKDKVQFESRPIEREQERENYFATCEKYRSQLAEKEKECERLIKKADRFYVDWCSMRDTISPLTTAIDSLTRQLSESQKDCNEEQKAHETIGTILAEFDVDGTSVGCARKAKDEISRLTTEVERLMKICNRLPLTQRTYESELSRQESELTRLRTQLEQAYEAIRQIAYADNTCRFCGTTDECDLTNHKPDCVVLLAQSHSTLDTKGEKP